MGKKPKKRGIPKEVIDELDIRKKRGSKSYEVGVSVSEQQTKISVPKIISLELNLKKGEKCEMFYDKEKRSIICKFK